MPKPTKATLLARYKDCEPRQFLQLDIFTGEVEGRTTNSDFGLRACGTYELISCPSAFRILIPMETDPDDAAALLLEVAEWLGQADLGSLRRVASACLDGSDDH